MDRWLRFPGVILISFLAGLPLSGGFFPAPAQPAPAGPAGVRTVTLIRHGIYDSRDERPDSVGKALTPLGVAQARLVAARLRSLPGGITSLTSSTLTRARETALVIGQDFPDVAVRKLALLSECTPPTWRADIMAGVDSAEALGCRDRFDRAFQEFFSPSPAGDRHDVLVCHGNVIRYLVTKVLKVDTMAWLQMSLGHCSITTVRIRPDGSARLLSFGDVGHLPPSMQTGVDEKTRDLVVPGP